MFNDMKARHHLEAQATTQFLKYALGHRSAVPAKNLTYERSSQNKSSMTMEMSTLDYSRKLPTLPRKHSGEGRSSNGSLAKSKATGFREVSPNLMTLESNLSRIKLPHLMEKQKRDRSLEQRKNPYLQKLPVKYANI